MLYNVYNVFNILSIFCMFNMFNMFNVFCIECLSCLSTVIQTYCRYLYSGFYDSLTWIPMNISITQKGQFMETPSINLVSVSECYAKV